MAALHAPSMSCCALLRSRVGLVDACARWRSRSACARRRAADSAASPAGSSPSRRDSTACCRALIRAAKTDGSAAYTLIGISFVYGIFHAAGPGHGKAVISSYLVANDETWRRGVALSFASALLQALTAIAIVGIAAVLLGATAKVDGRHRARDRDRQLRADRADRACGCYG